MTDMFDRMLWVYRAVFKQIAAGGGSIVVNIVMKGRTKFLFGVIGKNDYAAGRSCRVDLRDSSGNIISTMMYNATVDNYTFAFPFFDQSLQVDGDGPESSMEYILGRDEIIRVSASTLVQNEELTVTVRAIVDAGIPSINTTGSGGTVTTTETYNKVI